jgi:hypothetical protein
MGGATQLLDQSGQSIFGKIRILKQDNDKNLISHIEAERNWQLVHECPGHMTLREWPNKKKTGKIWHLYTDANRYGDPLYHLVISKYELPIFMKSAGVELSNTLYQPKYLPNLTNLDDTQLTTINKVDKIHRLLNHISAQGLERIIVSENINEVPIDKRLGIEVNEVKLWKTASGDYCSGCLQGKMKEHDRVPTTIISSVSIILELLVLVT